MASFNKISFCLLLIFAALGASSQERGVYELKSDSAVTLPDEFVWQLEKAPRDVVSDPQKMAPFRKSNFKPQKGNTYWFTYSIRNSLGKRTEIGLDAWSDLADFYVIRGSGKVDTCATGIMKSWSNKKEFRNSNVCSFSLDTSETITVMYRAEFMTRIYDTSFKIALISPDQRARKDLLKLEKRYLRDEGTIYNFYAGLFAMASLIYFLFFSIVRERLFLYFGIFVALLAISSSRVLFINALEHPAFTPYLNLISPLCFTAFVLFYREYFETRTNVPVWDKIAVALTLLYIGVNIHFAITNGFIFEAQNIVLMVALIATLAIIPFQLRNKDKRHKYFLLYASLPLLLLVPALAIAYLIYKLSGDTVTSGSFVVKFFSNADIIQLLALTWMVLYFSRTLIKRFNVQREQILMHEAEKQNILLHQEQEKRQLTEKLNAELEEKVIRRTAELNNSLKELKATQSQLVQSEKMASLGEMTAGIAHEIQNPLNFVNNFAEVNAELSEELRMILDKNITDPQSKQDVNSLIDDMISNGEKIRTHGKRADSIVKNMLQHSRSGEGSKEPTDINALIEEFVKLSFHGFRAKDKSFNADFRINTDPSVGKVMAIGQNLGRVILNLVNNAFYAVHTKNKKTGDDYSPMVIVSTEKMDGFVRITIEDNGDGIPESIKEKVFQPFFTTKPTGEGTGLGLSISYDIITKGHQGSMKAESAEGKGTIFTIELPA